MRRWQELKNKISTDGCRRLIFFEEAWHSAVQNNKHVISASMTAILKFKIESILKNKKETCLEPRTGKLQKQTFLDSVWDYTTIKYQFSIVGTETTEMVK